jgi:DNA-binding SARP family transcriptional activator
VSKLRAALAAPKLPAPPAIISAFGCHQLELPTDAWVDLEAAAQAIDQAETALRRQEPLQAFGPACVASAVTRRAFLPGEEGAWIERQRTRLRALRIRALDCLAEVWLANGEGALAVEAAQATIELEPFRETGYQRLMRAHAARGDRAEALRVYERCRRLLADELGVDPSPQTEAVFLELLG